jgi:hypothetical protein
MNLITNCEIKKMKFWGVLNHFLIGHVGRHGPVNWTHVVPGPGHQPIGGGGTARLETYSCRATSHLKRPEPDRAWTGPALLGTAQILGLVEHAFGIWKMKWRIRLKMPSYPMSKQKMIVTVIMCFHNFMRENHALDRHFRRCDRNLDYIPIIPHRYARLAPSQNASDDSSSTTNDISIDRIRNNLAGTILESRS